MQEQEGGVTVETRRIERVLAAELSSPGEARALLRAVLAAAGRSEWADAAELALTEVVTNTVLHARTPAEVVVEVDDARLLVEVTDRNPTMPSPRAYDAQATTGRGMALVAAVTHEHGVRPAEPTGKTVWFAFANGGEPSPESLEAAWADASWDVEDLLEPASGGDDDQHAEQHVDQHVVLRGMPPTLWLAARQHHDALLRELLLYGAAHDLDGDVDLEAADRARSTISGAVLAAVEAAQRTGTARPAVPEGHPSPLPWVPEPLDLELDVPAEHGRAFAALQDTLDAAELLARAGRLLAHPGLPEVIAVRDWACEQVVAQLAGAPPVPWPGTAQERFETLVHDVAAGDAARWDLAAVEAETRAVVAVDDANRVVAVSPALAELAGWSSEELVGRRVVAIIPSRYREAHVAGFTRHLATGEAHVLGVPLRLPLLRRDRTEVVCSVSVERSSAPGARALYTAVFEPSG